MARAISLVLLVVFQVLLGVLNSQPAHAQFKQMSFNLNANAGVTSPFTIGTNKVGFSYGGSFFIADGTPTGTRAIAEIDSTSSAIPGPLGYVYYSRYSTWNYYDPATDHITNIFTGPPAHYNYYGYPIFSSSTKNYGRWSIYISAMIWSYDPTAKNGTGEIKTERSYNVANILDLESVLYKDELVVRYDLKPPNATDNTRDPGLPSHLYPAPHLGYLYFAYNGTSRTGASQGIELWRTDLKRYKLVAEVNPGPGSSNPRYFCDVAGVGLFFFANPTKNTTKVSLYWSDGNSKFKRMSRYELSNFLSESIPIVSVGRRAVYIINDSNGRTLWATNGTAAGTVPLMTVSSDELVSTQKRAYFIATSAQYGTELYQTDGTVEGTVRVPFETVAGPGSSQPRGLTTTAKGEVLFSAVASTGNIEVFKYTPAV